MGASTGGTEALAKLFHLLPNLPERLPGIVVVQHMPPGFTQMYAERLNRELPFFDVKEAFDDEIIHSNTIRIAPGDSHLRIKRRDGYFATSVGGDNKVNGHCPSVDVLFDSVAAVAGKLATGVILTGMGADGARGLLRMRNAGAYTFGQDEESCVVYGMPWKAYEFGAVVRQAPLTDIPALLVAHLRGT
jgi:two-component system chemotaxis response regulator CheB